MDKQPDTNVTYELLTKFIQGYLYVAGVVAMVITFFICYIALFVLTIRR